MPTSVPENISTLLVLKEAIAKLAEESGRPMRVQDISTSNLRMNVARLADLVPQEKREVAVNGIKRLIFDAFAELTGRLEKRVELAHEAAYRTRVQMETRTADVDEVTELIGLIEELVRALKLVQVDIDELIPEEWEWLDQV